MGSIETVKLIHKESGAKKNVNVGEVEKYMNSGYIPLEDADKVAIETHEEDVKNPPIEKQTLPMLKEKAAGLGIRRFKRMSRDELLDAIDKVNNPKSEDETEGKSGETTGEE